MTANGEDRTKDHRNKAVPFNQGPRSNTSLDNMGQSQHDLSVNWFVGALKSWSTQVVIASKDGKHGTCPRCVAEFDHTSEPRERRASWMGRRAEGQLLRANFPADVLLEVWSKLFIPSNYCEHWAALWNGGLMKCGI